MSIFGSEAKLALNNKKKSGGLLGFASPGTPKAKTSTPKSQELRRTEISATQQLRDQSSLQETTPQKPRPEVKAPVMDTSSDGSDESDDESEEEIQSAVVKPSTTEPEGSEGQAEEESEEEESEEESDQQTIPNLSTSEHNKTSVSSGLCPPGYKVLKPSAMISAEFLEDPDNEIFIVKMPQSVNPKKMLNKPLPLANGKKVVIGNQELETVTYPSNQERTVILAESRHGGLKAVKVPISGKVFYQISLDVPSLPDIAECPRPEPPLRELPLGLKLRHPLLGSDYQAVLDGKVTKEKQSRKKRASVLENGDGLGQEPSKKKKRIKKEVS